MYRLHSNVGSLTGLILRKRNVIEAGINALNRDAIAPEAAAFCTVSDRIQTENNKEEELFL
jgi:hypothetical protein